MFLPLPAFGLIDILVLLASLVPAKALSASNTRLPPSLSRALYLNLDCCQEFNAGFRGAVSGSLEREQPPRLCSYRVAIHAVHGRLSQGHVSQSPPLQQLAVMFYPKLN